jgi:hypothetical protein
LFVYPSFNLPISLIHIGLYHKIYWWCLSTNVLSKLKMTSFNEERRFFFVFIVLAKIRICKYLIEFSFHFFSSFKTAKYLNHI